MLHRRGLPLGRARPGPAPDGGVGGTVLPEPAPPGEGDPAGGEAPGLEMSTRSQLCLLSVECFLVLNCQMGNKTHLDCCHRHPTVRGCAGAVHF